MPDSLNGKCNWKGIIEMWVQHSRGDYLHYFYPNMNLCKITLRKKLVHSAIWEGKHIE